MLVFNPLANLTTILAIAGINNTTLARLTDHLTLLNFLDNNREVFHGIAPRSFQAYHERAL
jgi:hypothetical protein